MSILTIYLSFLKLVQMKWRWKVVERLRHFRNNPLLVMAPVKNQLLDASQMVRESFAV